MLVANRFRFRHHIPRVLCAPLDSVDFQKGNVLRRLSPSPDRSEHKGWVSHSQCANDLLEVGSPFQAGRGLSIVGKADSSCTCAVGTYTQLPEASFAQWFVNAPQMTLKDLHDQKQELIVVVWRLWCRRHVVLSQLGMGRPS